MDIDIIEEDENPMLHRTDVRFEVTHEDATPSRLSVRDSLAAMLNKDAEEVVVHELDTKFGMRRTVGYAKVYESPEHAKDVEQDHMLQRNKIAADGSAEPEQVDEAASPEADEAESEETADEETDEDVEEAEEEEAESEEVESEEAEEEEAESEEVESEEAEEEEAEAEEAEAEEA